MQTQANAWFPTDFGSLIDQEVDAKSIAAAVCTVVPCEGTTMSFPLWVSDPDVGWYSENEEITLADGATDELVVTPKAAKGLTKVSNEAVNDSNPTVAGQIGKGLARQIAKSVDAAFFGSNASAPKAPAGLLDVSYTSLDNEGAALADLDIFHQARSDARDNGAELTHFVVANDVALALAQLKEATGSNKSLLQSTDDGVLLAGLPMLASVDVAAGEVWGLDRNQLFYVRRTGTEVRADASAAFSSDSTLVRATSRQAFGMVNPAGIIRVYDETPA